MQTTTHIGRLFPLIAVALAGCGGGDAEKTFGELVCDDVDYCGGLTDEDYRWCVDYWDNGVSTGAACRACLTSEMTCEDWDGFHNGDRFICMRRCM